MARSLFRANLTVALLAILATGGGLTYVQRSRAAEAARLRQENTRMRAEAYQRVASRSPRTVAFPAAPPTSPLESPPTPVAPVAASAPAARYRDSGQATPQTALQTLAWCGDQGNVERMRDVISFDPAARALAEAYYATLPAAVHAQFGGLDAMAATVLTRAIMGQPYPETEVLATARFEPVDGDPDRRRLSLPGTAKDGQIFVRTEGVWKYVLTEEAIRAYFSANRIVAPDKNGGG